MRLKTREAQERRLQQICRLDRKGFRQTEIAEMLDCTQSWVSQVLKRAGEEGVENLKAKDPPPGKTPALGEAELADLAEVLEAEARVAGFATDGWTRKRVAQVIYERYGVRHHPSHVSRILAKIGFTRQKPQRQDYRRHAQAVEKWDNQTLPKLKKKQETRVTASSM